MSKKTDSIEVRLSPELKARLAQKSAEHGTTMSGYVRDLIAAGGGSAKPNGVSPMKLAHTTLLTALPAAILAAVVFGGAAATATPELRVAFAEMDVNGDGVVTAEEYAALLTSELTDDMMPEVCVNDPALSDGHFDPNEIARADLATMDSNGDFQVTYDELYNTAMSERAQEFLSLDANADGVLEVTELLADLTQLVDLPEEDDLLGLGAACVAALDKMDVELPGDDAPEALTGDDLATEARLTVAEMDANRDGVVSLREYLDM